MSFFLFKQNFIQENASAVSLLTAVTYLNVTWYITYLRQPKSFFFVYVFTIGYSGHYYSYHLKDSCLNVLNQPVCFVPSPQGIVKGKRTEQW